jgi:hypothetical protein
MVVFREYKAVMEKNVHTYMDIFHLYLRVKQEILVFTNNVKKCLIFMENVHLCVDIFQDYFLLTENFLWFL